MCSFKTSVDFSLISAELEFQKQDILSPKSHMKLPCMYLLNKSCFRPLFISQKKKKKKNANMILTVAYFMISQT